MSLEDILIALRASDEGAIDREALSRLLAIIDTWDRGGLHPSAGELLTKQFRIDASKVRRWESEITGQSQRRIGRYQLRRKVGQGGMGLVFEALDPNLGRTVALKLLSGDRLDSPVSVQRFLREAKSSGSFNHPNIVHAFDAGIDGDLPYLVMEFVDGENLYQVLKRRGRIPPAEGLDWLLQAARALEVLERKRWVHGDVKPSNFIITRDGVVKLADLGLCGPPGKPRTGVSPHGTPPYIAPEVLAGDFIDHRADLYSLGATIYHLIAGRPPRVSRTIEELRAEMSTPLVPLHEVVPSVSGDLSRIVMRLLETSPKLRFSGGLPLLAALEPLLPGPPVDADSETVADRPPSEQFSPPRRGIWVALGVSVIAVGIVIGVLTGPGKVDESDPAAETGEVVGTDPTTENPPTIVAPIESSSWDELHERAAGDYASLFAWLAGEGAVHPEVETWRAQLTAELSTEVAPAWGTLVHEFESLRMQGRFHDGITLLDSFPERWRAGPYFVAWEEATMHVRQDRTARLARFLLALDGVDASLGALQVWRSLGNERPEDALWFRLRIEAELGGLPFLREVNETVAQAAAERIRRRTEVPRALLDGGLPSPRLIPLSPESVLEELALHWLAAHPRVAGTAGALLPRIFEAGVLHEIDPLLLGVLLRQVGETADAAAEVRAATLAAGALLACQEFDLARAEELWTRLDAPDFLGTVAAERTLADRDEIRADLARGAFLRSGAFVAKVSGAWQEPTTFSWSAKELRFDEEWRLDPTRFAVTGEGRRAKGRGDWQSLELAVPFTESFSFECTFEPPAESWSLAFGRGDNTLGFAGTTADGRCRVIAGERASVSKILGNGKGVPFQLALDPGHPGRFTIRLRYDAGRWSLGEGGLAFSVKPAPPPAWIWLALPTGAWIGSISITGEVVEPWLIAREKHFQGE